MMYKAPPPKPINAAAAPPFNKSAPSLSFAAASASSTPPRPTMGPPPPPTNALAMNQRQPPPTPANGTPPPIVPQSVIPPLPSTSPSTSTAAAASAMKAPPPPPAVPTPPPGVFVRTPPPKPAAAAPLSPTNNNNINNSNNTAARSPPPPPTHRLAPPAHPQHDDEHNNIAHNHHNSNGNGNYSASSSPHSSDDESDGGLAAPSVHRAPPLPSSAAPSSTSMPPLPRVNSRPSSSSFLPSTTAAASRSPLPPTPSTVAARSLQKPSVSFASESDGSNHNHSDDGTHNHDQHELEQLDERDRRPSLNEDNNNNNHLSASPRPPALTRALSPPQPPPKPTRLSNSSSPFVQVGAAASRGPPIPPSSSNLAPPLPSTPAPLSPSNAMSGFSVPPSLPSSVPPTSFANQNPSSAGAAPSHAPPSFQPTPPSSSPYAAGATSGAASSSSQPLSSPTGTGLNLDFSSMSTAAVMDSFLSSESDYISHLSILTEQFVQRLRFHIQLQRPVVPNEEIRAMFLNVENIHDFHRQLQSELISVKERGGVDQLLQQLGRVMGKFIPFFKLYAEYVKNHREATKLLTEVRKSNKEFDFFCTLNELCSKQKLSPLLMSPVLRLAQYLMYLGTIYEKAFAHSPSSSSSSPAATELASAISHVQHVTDEIATYLKDEKSRRDVVNVQLKLFGNTIDVLSPSRFVVRYAKMQILQDNLLGKGQHWEKMYLVLFNDMLLYGTVAGKLTAAKVKAVLQLPGLAVEDLNDGTATSATLSKQVPDLHLQCAFRIKSRSHKPVIVQSLSSTAATTSNEKQMWLSLIQDTVTKFESTLEQPNQQASPMTAMILNPAVTMSADDFEKMILKKKGGGGTVGVGTMKGGMTGTMRPSTTTLARPTLQLQSNHNNSSANHSNSNGAPVAPPLSPTKRQAPWPGANASASSPPPAPPLSSGAPPVPTPAPSKYLKLFDANYQCDYYANTETGEVQWDRPADFVDESAVPAAGMSSQSAGVQVGSGAPPPPGGDVPVIGVGAPAPPPLTGGSVPPPRPAAAGGGGGGGGDSRGDLLSAIQNAGGVANLKKASQSVASPAVAAKDDPSLGQTLATTLARYRQFVQDDVDDFEADEEWED